MTNHPNRGWRGRWIVSGDEARHNSSGLIVRFRRVDGGADGKAINGQEVAQALIEIHGLDAAGKMLTRLMREAGDIFQEKNDEYRN